MLDNTPTFNQATLVCRLRHNQLLRGSSQTAGEIELENASPRVLAIQSEMHPLQYLDLVVTDTCGTVPSQGHDGAAFSPREEIDTLRLAPGMKYRHVVSLLATVPLERRLPGTYTVQAVYEYRHSRVALP